MPSRLMQEVEQAVGQPTVPSGCVKVQGDESVRHARHVQRLHRAVWGRHTAPQQKCAAGICMPEKLAQGAWGVVNQHIKM